MPKKGRIKRYLPDILKIITPPPYVVGQRIAIEIKHPHRTGAPMSARVDAASGLELSLTFGGGKGALVKMVGGRPQDTELD